MCDYSLHAQKTRDAEVNETLVTHRFSTATTGFGPSGHEQGQWGSSELAVCVRPGTELAFSEPVKAYVDDSTGGFFDRSTKEFGKEAVFSQVDPMQPMRHHDGVMFPDGTFVLLNNLLVGQTARVLQIPSVVVQVSADKGATEELPAGSQVSETIDLLAD